MTTEEKENIIATQIEIIQGYYNRISMKKGVTVEDILQWLESDLQYIQESKAVVSVEKLLSASSVEDKPHETSLVMCDLCNHEWVAVRPDGLTELECPNCNNMVQFSNI